MPEEVTTTARMLSQFDISCYKASDLIKHPMVIGGLYYPPDLFEGSRAEALNHLFADKVELYKELGAADDHTGLVWDVNGREHCALLITHSRVSSVAMCRLSIAPGGIVVEVYEATTLTPPSNTSTYFQALQDFRDFMIKNSRSLTSARSA